MRIDHPDFVDGSRWFHVWLDPMPYVDLMTVSVQVETVGVRISAPPYMIITPSAARNLLALLKQLPHVVIDDMHISIRID